MWRCPICSGAKSAVGHKLCWPVVWANMEANMTSVRKNLRAFFVVGIHDNNAENPKENAHVILRVMNMCIMQYVRLVPLEISALS